MYHFLHPIGYFCIYFALMLKTSKRVFALQFKNIDLLNAARVRCTQRPLTRKSQDDK